MGGRVTAVRAMLASPGLGGERRVQGGVAGALGGAGELRASLGAKGRLAQLATWKCSLRVAIAAFVAEDFAVDRERIAVGRVEGEVRAVEVDQDRAQPQRDAFEDLGQGVGDGGDLGGFGVDVERRPDHDVAEVIGTGDRRGDHREAERGALVGAGQVDLARNVEGVGAGSRAGHGGADLRSRGAARVGLLFEAGVAGCGGWPSDVSGQ